MSVSSTGRRTSPPFRVAVVGAGPAGVATAIHLARRGLEVTVIERAPDAPDKACGDGILPAGLLELRRLEILERLSPAVGAPIDAITWVQEDGSRATGRLPAPGGIGLPRVALMRALVDAAQDAGVEFAWRCVCRRVRRSRDGVRLETSRGRLDAELLVAADGARSRLRRAAGLDRPPPGPRRYGLRRYYRVSGWPREVEVHLGDRLEAFVTPLGPELVGLAFLWDRDDRRGSIDMESLLACFPIVAARLRGAEIASRPRGAGPLACASRARCADRLVLVGDAAGFVDAVTGEGLSLALSCAAALGDIVPEALAGGATRQTLAPYERAFQRVFRRYALVTRAVLALARRPRARRVVVRALARHPRALDRLMAWALTPRADHGRPPGRNPGAARAVVPESASRVRMARRRPGSRLRARSMPTESGGSRTASQR